MNVNGWLSVNAPVPVEAALVASTVHVIGALVTVNTDPRIKHDEGETVYEIFPVPGPPAAMTITEVPATLL